MNGDTGVCASSCVCGNHCAGNRRSCLMPFLSVLSLFNSLSLVVFKTNCFCCLNAVVHQGTGTVVLVWGGM